MRRKKTISKRYLRPRWGYLSQDRKGILQIDGFSVNYLANKYSTPLYILVEKEIRSRLRRFKAAFPYPKLKPQYASKCNSNLEILKIVREEGFELDASSVGEIILGLLADFDPEQITFTNLYKRKQDIIFAAKLGIQSITADSIEEIRKIADIAQKLRKRIRIFIRVNPMLELGKYTTKKQQYGIPWSQVYKAIDLAIDSKYVDLTGFHFHGSYIAHPKVYFLAAKKLMKLARYCWDYKTKIKTIDLGGGFPVEYNSSKVFQPEDMGKKFARYFQKLAEKYDIPSPSLIFEPGKFVVANAGVGLIKVVSRKSLGRKKMIITDGSTYGFTPDPIIYNCYYDILPATKMTKPRVHKVNVAGCTCDSIDIIGSNRKLPKMGEGDLLAIMDCGAYSNVMASNFNTLKRAPMVMIKETGDVKLIRRRDRYSEMFAPELDVLKVAQSKELKNLYNMYRVNINKLWQAQTKKKEKSKKKKR